VASDVVIKLSVTSNNRVHVSELSMPEFKPPKIPQHRLRCILKLWRTIHSSIVAAHKAYQTCGSLAGLPIPVRYWTIRLLPHSVSILHEHFRRLQPAAPTKQCDYSV